MSAQSMKRESLRKNTVMLYLLQMSTYVFPLITFPYLTRILEPDTYGLMVNGNAVIAYFQTFVDFGFILSATRKCTLLRNDRDALRQEVSATIFAKLLLSVVGFAVLLSVVFLMPAWSNLAPYLVISYLSVIATCFIPDYLFRGMEQMSTITYRTVAVRALFTVSIFLLVHSKADFLLVPALTAAGNVFASVWALLYAKRACGFSIQVVPVGTVLTALRESVQYFASRIAGTVYASSNAVVLGFVCPPAIVASYGVANTIVSAVKNLAAPLADSLFPHLVRTKDIALARRILAKAVPAVLVAALLLFCFADPVVAIAAGAGYHEAATYMRWMIPLILMALPSYLLGFPMLGALDKAEHANWSVMVSAVLYVLGIAVLWATGFLAPVPCIALLCGAEFVTLLYRAIAVAVFSRRSGSSVASPSER